MTHRSSWWGQSEWQNRPPTAAWPTPCFPLRRPGTPQPGNKKTKSGKCRFSSAQEAPINSHRLCCTSVDMSVLSTSEGIWDFALSVSISCSASSCKTESIWEVRWAEAVLVCLAWLRMDLDSWAMRMKKSSTDKEADFFFFKVLLQSWEFKPTTNYCCGPVLVVSFHRAVYPLIIALH